MLKNNKELIKQKLIIVGLKNIYRIQGDRRRILIADTNKLGIMQIILKRIQIKLFYIRFQFQPKR